MSLDEYGRLLERQRLNSSRPALNIYLTALYGSIETEIYSSPGLCLELGSGAAISALFLSNEQILRTDYLNLNRRDVVNGIDAMNLPFPDKSFSLVYGIDMLHHVPNPLLALKEAIRVLDSGQQCSIIFVEPYVSLFSFLIYRVFHAERTSWLLSISDLEQATSFEASDGDQCVAKSIYTHWEQVKSNNVEFRDIRLVASLMHPLSFFATGGVNRPLPIPAFLVGIVMKIESNLPNWILRLTASRIILKMERVQSPVLDS